MMIKPLLVHALRQMTYPKKSRNGNEDGDGDGDGDNKEGTEIKKDDWVDRHVNNACQLLTRGLVYFSYYFCQAVSVLWNPSKLSLACMTPFPPTLSWYVEPTVERLYTLTLDAESMLKMFV